MSAFGYRTNPLPERYARKLARGSRTFGGAIVQRCFNRLFDRNTVD